MCYQDQRRVCMNDQKMKRQERFVQQKRFKARVKKHSYFTWGSPTKAFDWDNTTKATVGILYHTRKRCSCYMCGNPRKYTGEKTIAEQSSEQLFALDN